MGRVRGENDRPAPRGYAYDLQPHRVPADEVQGNAGEEFHVAVVKTHATRINAPHHSHYVLDLEGSAEAFVAHVAAGGVVHLELLQMERRGREEIEVSDM